MSADRVAYRKGLHEIAEGVHAWLAPDGGWGLSNAGLIEGAGSTLLVDTLFDLPMTREMLTAMAPVTDRSPLRHAVNTHANGDHCYGNALLPAGTVIHAGPHFDDDLHEVPPALLAQLMTAELGPVLGPYLRRNFGAYTFADIPVRGADETVTAPTTLEVGGRAVEVLPLGPAHTRGDVVVWVPDARTLFAGDLLFIGGTPMIWSGPVGNWIAACDRMLALDPVTVVPGHGPVTGPDGIRQVRDYLTFLHGYAVSSIAAGRTWREAAAVVDLGRYAAWGETERTVANLYCAYRSLDPATEPITLLELLTAMAGWQRP
ncbi:MBL fold metallo-hydrolase [Actinoplanes sp. NPDC048967]|uniref:MBL fold metallo-hydrolase n=1 Tax=Actinoplanes sp. NPDC048967 TaxID=3155269 RepID=UPI0033DB5D7F